MVSTNSPNDTIKTELKEDSKIAPTDLYQLWSDVQEKNPKLKISVKDVISVVFGVPIKPFENEDIPDNESNKSKSKKKGHITRKQKASAEKEKAITSTL